MGRKRQEKRCRWCGGRTEKDYYQVEGRCYCSQCMESFHRDEEE